LRRRTRGMSLPLRRLAKRSLARVSAGRVAGVHGRGCEVGCLERQLLLCFALLCCADRVPEFVADGPSGVSSA
jgi:hypothetical protein